MSPSITQHEIHISIVQSTHPLLSDIGIQPACKDSKNLKEPNRRPRGTKQNVEFKMRRE